MKELLAWWVRQESEPFDNRRVLESYCKNDVTVLMQVVASLGAGF